MDFSNHFRQIPKFDAIHSSSPGPATWHGVNIWDPPPSDASSTPPRGRRNLFAPSLSGILASVENREAQLSSVTTSLDDLVERVSRVAEEVHAAGDESLAYDLFEVERSLRTAHRRLVAATRRMK